MYSPFNQSKIKCSLAHIDLTPGLRKVRRSVGTVQICMYGTVSRDVDKSATALYTLKRAGVMKSMFCNPA